MISISSISSIIKISPIQALGREYCTPNTLGACNTCQDDTLREALKPSISRQQCYNVIFRQLALYKPISHKDDCSAYVASYACAYHVCVCILCVCHWCGVICVCLYHMCVSVSYVCALHHMCVSLVCVRLVSSGNTLVTSLGFRVLGSGFRFQGFRV